CRSRPWSRRARDLTRRWSRPDSRRPRKGRRSTCTSRRSAGRDLVLRRELTMPTSATCNCIWISGPGLKLDGNWLGGCVISRSGLEPPPASRRRRGEVGGQPPDGGGHPDHVGAGVPGRVAPPGHLSSPPRDVLYGERSSPDTVIAGQRPNVLVVPANIRM